MAARKEAVSKKTSKKAARKPSERSTQKLEVKSGKKTPLLPVTEIPVTMPVAQQPPSMFAQHRELARDEKWARAAALRTQSDGRIYAADEAQNQYLLRRPTGIMELDVALGGGFPAGGASMISGPFNSGKSWLLFRTLAMQQQIYGSDFLAAIHVGETQFPFDQAAAAGCRVPVPDSVLNYWSEWRWQRGLPPFTPQELAWFKPEEQEVGRLDVITGETGEDVLDAVLQSTAANVYSVIGVDSISGLQPAADANKDLTDNEKRGAHATMMKRFWLRFTPMMNRGLNVTTVLFVQQVVANQERANANPAIQKYIKEWMVRGSEATKHYKLIDLVMWSGEKIRHGSNENREIIGKWVEYKTEKGKAGTHDNITGNFPYYYHLNGVDLHGELMASAIRRGILLNVGSGIQVFNTTTRQPVEGLFARNEQEFRQLLVSSFEAELAVRREILNAAGKPCLYR